MPALRTIEMASPNRFQPTEITKAIGNALAYLDEVREIKAVIDNLSLADPSKLRQLRIKRGIIKASDAESYALFRDHLIESLSTIRIFTMKMSKM